MVQLRYRPSTLAFVAALLCEYRASDHGRSRRLCNHSCRVASRGKGFWAKGQGMQKTPWEIAAGTLEGAMVRDERDCQVIPPTPCLPEFLAILAEKEFELTQVTGQIPLPPLCLENSPVLTFVGQML